MQARDFCYWLQGHFELNPTAELNAEQVETIKRHLNMVFIHDIDPSFPFHQQDKLNAAHEGTGVKPAVPFPTPGTGGGPTFRC